MVFTQTFNESCWCGYFYFTHLLHDSILKEVGGIIPLFGCNLYVFGVVRSMSWTIFMQGFLRMLSLFNTDKLVPFGMVGVQHEKLTGPRIIRINTIFFIKNLLDVKLLYSD